jgi:fucose 4-O-acetylase-like acetyltransferase
MGHKNLSIDIAKGLAIILVVYGHLIEHSMAPWAQDFLGIPVFKVIYTFHMPLFFFVSGYLMAGSLSRHGAGEVFRSRVRSLLVPFIVLAVSCALITAPLNMLFGTVRTDFIKDLADQLFFKPSVWFLWTLFLSSVWLVISVKINERFGWLAFAGAYIFLMVLPYSDYGALYFFKWFYLFYLAGYLSNKLNINISSARTRGLILIFSLGLFIWLINYWTADDYIYVNKMHLVPAEILRIFYRYIMGFLGIIIVYYMSRWISTTKTGPVLGTVGVYALDIYIVQTLLIEGIWPRWVYRSGFHLDFNSPVVLYLILPLLTLAFVGLCMGISQLIIRKIPLLNSLLLGGRA